MVKKKENNMKLLYLSKAYNKELKLFFNQLQNKFSEIRHYEIITDSNIFELYDEYKPDVVLIHYNRYCFSEKFYNHIKDSFNIYWRNDERFPLEAWYKTMNSINLFLTSSTDSRDALRSE